MKKKLCFLYNKMLRRDAHRRELKYVACIREIWENENMDMGNMMKIMGAWNRFKGNHPKFPAFCKAVAKHGIRENSVVEIVVTTPEGERIETSIRVQADDMELFRSFGQMNL